MDNYFHSFYLIVICDAAHKGIGTWTADRCRHRICIRGSLNTASDTHRFRDDWLDDEPVKKLQISIFFFIFYNYSQN